jgi:hypothetical protein
VEPWLVALFAFIKAIPILDRWMRESSKIYFDWRYAQNEREHEAALDKAQKEYDTTDLQKEIGEKL